MGGGFTGGAPGANGRSAGIDHGQWPIGPALAVVGTLSLTIWSGILFLLLA